MSAAATALAMLAGLMKPANRQPLRVGVLNTGELVLVDDTSACQVLSAGTTRLIREQLINTDIAASELVLFPPGGGSDSEATGSAP